MAYREEVGKRPAFPAGAGADDLRAALGELPDGPVPAAEVVDQLVAAVEPGLVGTTGPRYFGFVIGGALDAATAADMLATAWDQHAYNLATSPAATVEQDVARGWLKELLGLPPAASFGFVTGAQGANTVALAAARHHVLARAGWDVERGGWPEARRSAWSREPSDMRRSTGPAAPRARGRLGRAGGRGPAGRDRHGRARACADGGTAGPTIVCLQAGNVNTGADDELAAGTAVAHHHGAWVHVDGAFGPRAAASPTTRHLTAGVEAADSWGTDGHKWLNVPYDCGYVFCAHPTATPPPCRSPPATSPARASARSAPRPTSCPSRRAGPGASPRGPRCASWAATGWRTWSSAAAPTPGGSPNGSAPPMASTSPTTWC